MYFAFANEPCPSTGCDPCDPFHYEGTPWREPWAPPGLPRPQEFWRVLANEEIQRELQEIQEAAKRREYKGTPWQEPEVLPGAGEFLRVFARQGLGAALGYNPQSRKSVPGQSTSYTGYTIARSSTKYELYGTPSLPLPDPLLLRKLILMGMVIDPALYSGVMQQYAAQRPRSPNKTTVPRMNWNDNHARIKMLTLALPGKNSMKMRWSGNHPKIKILTLLLPKDN